MRRADCFDGLERAIAGYGNVLEIMGILEDNPHYLENCSLTLAALRPLRIQVHDAYFVHIFSYFESSLRDYWQIAVKRTNPPTERLISSIAARRGVPQDTLDQVQQIREFRNSLVHQENQAAVPYEVREARRHLNRFIARLPLEW